MQHVAPITWHLLNAKNWWYMTGLEGHQESLNVLIVHIWTTAHPFATVEAQVWSLAFRLHRTSPLYRSGDFLAYISLFKPGRNMKNQPICVAAEKHHCSLLFFCLFFFAGIGKKKGFFRAKDVNHLLGF